MIDPNKPASVTEPDETNAEPFPLDDQENFYDDDEWEDEEDEDE
jgi:hypothetical protein